MKVRGTISTSLLAALPAVLLAAAGCALTHPTDPYAPVPFLYIDENAIRQTKAAEEPAQPAPNKALTLQECIKTALIRNPQIAARAWDTQAATAGLQSAVGQRWPTVHLAAGYADTLNDQRLIGPYKPGDPGAWSSNIFSGNVILSLPLFTGGRIINQIRAADLMENAAIHRLSRTKNELIFNVSSTFYAILSQRQVIESLGFSRKTLEEHRKRVQDLIQAQKAAKVDLLRTEVRLADIEQKLLSARNILAIQQRVLANLMGLPQDENAEALHIKGTLAQPDGADKPAVDTKEALARREDYQAARRKVEGQAVRVDIARAARWPTVMLDAGYGDRWAAGDVNRQNGASESEDFASVGITVGFALFEGGRIEAGVRRERAQLAAAQEDLRNLELRIRLEIQTAVLNVTAAHQKAREALRIEREKYEVGKGSITNVLDAQSALLQAETNHTRALTEYNTSVAQLRLATGERWSEK